MCPSSFCLFLSSKTCVPCFKIHVFLFSKIHVSDVPSTQASTVHQEDAAPPPVPTAATALDTAIDARMQQAKRCRIAKTTDTQHNPDAKDTAADQHAAMRRPLPACLVELQDQFARLHALLVFFARQHVQPTWRQVQATLVERGEVMSLEQLYATAALAPDVLVLHHQGRCVGWM